MRTSWSRWKAAIAVIPMPKRETREACMGPLWPLACLLAAQGALAARPMATDDTATTPGGECQIEAWGERVDDVRGQVLAPACGLTDTLELDAGFARTQGSTARLDSMVLGLKWVPSHTRWDTPAGEVRLGLIGGMFWARAPGENWKSDTAVLVGLASLDFAPTWTLYTNLTTARNLDSGQHVNGVRMAVAWQPVERALLFVEGLRTSDSGNLRNAGFRLWAIPEVLGLDVITSRSVNGGLSFSVGFGWYGIRLP
jgi:hypothetical protein